MAEDSTTEQRLDHIEQAMVYFLTSTVGLTSDRFRVWSFQ